jgi:hypothetical protein
MRPSLHPLRRPRGHRPDRSIASGREIPRRLWAIAWLASLGAGCFGGPEPIDLSAFSEPELAAHISRIEQQIEADHTALETLVARPRTEADAPLHDDAELREIANRLSSHMQELEQLQAEQARR